VTIELEVNGELRRVQAAPDTPLLYVLRNDLGLCAAKLGCGLEQCGSCTVIVDGEARMSCRLPISALAHSEITTLEGIGTREQLHPLQRAFIAENAAQCGYCTAGILMTAKALLDRNPSPDESEIRHALRDNLCRCGAHNRVVRAVQRVAREATGKP
jgi:nicotinate dehydrogenase subunit A